MENVIALNTRKIFGHQEAQNLIPIVWRITDQYSAKVQALINRLEVVQSRNDELGRQLEIEINDLVEEWQTKLEKLGACPKGLWIADFDSGDGYYCWKYPEKKIIFWHHYNDGFSGRIKISEKPKSKSELELT